MFNETSIINEVNIVNKVICFLIVILISLFSKDITFILFIDIFLLLITKKYHNLFKFNIGATLLLITNYLYPQFLWITKFLIIIIYLILLSKVTKLTELRYVIEKTLYKFKNKKITYHFFYYIYFLKTFKNHLKRMLILKDDYEIKLTLKFLLFIVKQAYIKAKNSKKDFIEINDIRFYNMLKDRTYIEKITWESYDTSYLICHIIIFIITLVYGG